MGSASAMAFGLYRPLHRYGPTTDHEIPKGQRNFLYRVSMVATLAALFLSQLTSPGKLSDANFPRAKRISAISSAIPTFNTSGLAAFMQVFEDLRRPQERRLVLMCSTKESCGGIADRVKGIPFAMAIALLSHRQFIVDSSLLTNGNPPGGESAHRFRFIDSRCSDEALLHAAIEDDSVTVYVTSNCEWPPILRDELIKGTHHRAPLAVLRRECNPTVLCGAAVIHHVEAFSHDLHLAHRSAASLGMLPLRNYTTLHIRAGGSSISLNGVEVPAVSWYDGHRSTLPQTWIDLFAAFSYASCQRPLVLLSDSVRLVSEIRIASSNKLPIFHCCTQPLHRDRCLQPGFFHQEVFDLYVMARSKHVIAGAGSFGKLGRYWLGRGGPAFTVVSTETEARRSIAVIAEGSYCTAL